MSTKKQYVQSVVSEIQKKKKEWRSLSELPDVDRTPVILARSMGLELKCAATGLPGRLDLMDLR